MKAARMGDPFDDRTEIGPQARSDLRDIAPRSKASLAKGARCLLGGKIPEGAARTIRRRC
jgi:succinate-semialdehyde dehydrogenase/glutarate-semialdehyde dehydrogenase